MAAVNNAKKPTSTPKVDPKKTASKKPTTPPVKAAQKAEKPKAGGIDEGLLANAIKATEKPAAPKKSPADAAKEGQMAQLDKQFKSLVERNQQLEGVVAQVQQQKQAEEAQAAKQQPQGQGAGLPAGLNGPASMTA